MADLLQPTPFAEKLAAELRALHERREREALSDPEEARYAELWAWWQSGGSGGEVAAAPAPLDEAAVPEEWRQAFADAEDPLLVAQGSPDAAPQETDGADDLVRAWEDWQAHGSAGDPFSSIPGLDGDAARAPTEEEVIAARAEVLGDPSTGSGDLGGDLAEDGVLFEAEDAGGAATASAGRESEAPIGRDAEPTTAAQPARAPATPRGAQRVVIHLLDGQTRRGDVVDVQLDRPTISFIAASGSTETLPRAEVRAMFFMRSPGEPPPAPAGRRVVVTFRDGRELAGSSADHDQLSDGFTLVPSDERTNAALVWISRAAVREVKAG